MNERIASLEKRGFRVMVEHQRRYGMFGDLENNGGETKVTLRRSFGELAALSSTKPAACLEVVGFARCSKKDPTKYNAIT